MSQTKLSDQISKNLESMIIDGTLKANDRLPPERELAGRFHVSRPSLREAIQNLKAKGLITSRQGGGNYVSEHIGESLQDPLLQALAEHDEFRYDLLEFRDALEGIATYYAAIRSTDLDKEQLTASYNALVQAHKMKLPNLEAKRDAEFHLMIAKCAHNAILMHSMKALFTMLSKSIAANLDNLFEHSHAREDIMQQHTKIYEAIMASDAKTAKVAVREHLAYVEKALLEVNRLKSRRQRALQQADILL
ncbi:GntR family transcriptional regulator [Marinomonas agarivorans]|nr:GntR family transcriptional regulator [Marinomonas agarivorans]